jgi:hypothetical protein
MANTAATILEEQRFILSDLSPGPGQRRLALAIVLVLLIAFVIIAGPLGTIQLGRIEAFVPGYAVAMFVNDSITAVLLFAQFSILRSRASSKLLGGMSSRGAASMISSRMRPIAALTTESRFGK